MEGSSEDDLDDMQPERERDLNKFFVRINPEEGTKCTAKFGTSRKTGGTVQRKVAAINSRVATFLQRLTEFEWKTAK